MVRSSTLEPSCLRHSLHIPTYPWVTYGKSHNLQGFRFFICTIRMVLADTLSNEDCTCCTSMTHTPSTVSGIRQEHLTLTSLTSVLTDFRLSLNQGTCMFLSFWFFLFPDPAVPGLGPLVCSHLPKLGSCSLVMAHPQAPGQLSSPPQLHPRVTRNKGLTHTLHQGWLSLLSRHSQMLVTKTSCVPATPHPPSRHLPARACSLSNT